MRNRFQFKQVRLDWRRFAVTAMALLIALSTTPMPVAFGQTDRGAEFQAKAKKLAAKLAPSKPHKSVSVRKGSHDHKLVKPKLSFSNKPSDLEISTARVFGEPLAPVSTAVVPGENAALAKALVAFKAKQDSENISDLTAFLSAFPKSRWQPALELELGLLRFRTGYLDDALTFLQSAWEGAKSEKGRAQTAMANRAVTE